MAVTVAVCLCATLPNCSLAGVEFWGVARCTKLHFRDCTLHTALCWACNNHNKFQLSFALAPTHTHMHSPATRRKRGRKKKTQNMNYVWAFGAPLTVCHPLTPVQGEPVIIKSFECTLGAGHLARSLALSLSHLMSLLLLCIWCCY